jgi:uncharacterized surface protein with fasciclin (FAS1) repeats
MNIRRTLAVAAAAAVVAATACTGGTAAQASSPRAAALAAVAPAKALGSTSLASIVVPAYGSSWDKNWSDYNIVTHAVLAVLKAKPSSKVGVLTKGGVALTAFLPNDRAFQILVKQLTGKTLLRERAVFGAVAKLGVPTIEKVLLYHVVPGATIDSTHAVKANGATLRTALGATIHVAVYRGPIISLWDKSPRTRNPRVILSQVDINKGNKQIAHGIDRVLLPLPIHPVR